MATPRYGSTPARRKRRPHPARRARRFTGVAASVSTIVLAGWLSYPNLSGSSANAAAAEIDPSTQATPLTPLPPVSTTTGQVTSGQTTGQATPDQETTTPSTTLPRRRTVFVVPATPRPRVRTSSHGS